MEESGVAQIGSMATIFLDGWCPRLEFALLWLGAFNAALIFVAMVAVICLGLYTYTQIGKPALSITIRPLSVTFHNFQSLSVTFRHFPHN